jgi:dephospho-CoA kinase
MIRVGITGGMGSGKSLVLAMLAERGAATLSADDIANDMIEPDGPAYKPVASRFPDVIKRDGRPDHARLAAKVFTDARSLAWLDGLVHPLVARRLEEKMAELKKAGEKVCAVEVPLLVEAGLAPEFDVVVAVVAPEDVRVARMVEDGWDSEDVLRRIGLQAADEIRIKAADVTIDNAGSLADLEASVSRLWDRLEQEAR